MFTWIISLYFYLFIFEIKRKNVTIYSSDKYNHISFTASSWFLEHLTLRFFVLVSSCLQCHILYSPFHLLSSTYLDYVSVFFHYQAFIPSPLETTNTSETFGIKGWKSSLPTTSEPFGFIQINCFSSPCVSLWILRETNFKVGFDFSQLWFIYLCISNVNWFDATGNYYNI